VNLGRTESGKEGRKVFTPGMGGGGGRLWVLSLCVNFVALENWTHQCTYYLKTYTCTDHLSPCTYNMYVQCAMHCTVLLVYRQLMDLLFLSSFTLLTANRWPLYLG
jgi:hypothetical protein